MTAFIGYQEHPLSVDNLLVLIHKLINKSITDNTYYFLRWTHGVSGIYKLEKNSISDQFQFPMLEGQIFNHQLELRWKYKKNNTYEVLLLSINGEDQDFQALDKKWYTEDRQANFYPPTETRFPKVFSYPDPEKLQIKQRYFQDQTTATVHFIALTL
ncbi:hypothetical protein H6F32_08780 [Anabaena sp. FACHB-1237]|uniref:hypothetical protein n=1 Tax=Anabaena sp. FACHB-1237 TaxID=2692769 RepID=UPI0016815E06|nr:hypothetical protein [Anabaena sp. FACHB-1237]MBD2137677.1 hypothetical protein [Anabaena sp. FACHB-1237]